MNVERRVDHSALRVNQAFIIGLLGLALLLGAIPLVAFVAAVMVIGTIWPGAGLFKRIYQHLLKPAGLVQPDIRPDNPEPHRFAQGVGGVCTALGTLALLAGATVPGWALVGLVIVLAALNLFAGWCAGCTLYYWLSRLGVPGFDRQPLEVER